MSKAGDTAKQEDRVVKSAGRVLSIFEYFAAVQSPASVSEISRRLAIPQSSTSILLNDLQRLGYLEQDSATRQYAPTIRLALIGQWTRKAKMLEGRLMPMLEAIRAETDATVMLGFLNGNWTQYIYVLESNAKVRLRFKHSTLRPSVRTAIGKVLLARKSDDDILKTVRSFNADQDQTELRLDPAAFLSEIHQTDQRGYGETIQSLTPGAAMLAMQVPSTNAGVPMAVGVGAPLDHMQINKASILETLQTRIGALKAELVTDPVPTIPLSGAKS